MKNRVVGLDILRSLAIIWVVYMHAVSLLPQKYWGFYFKLNFLKIDGVSLFFVLSGFLIGKIIINLFVEKSFDLKQVINFWLRRWFRTIPNYLLVLLLVLSYNIYYYQSFGEFSFKFLFFTQNFFKSHPNFFPEAWSLSVEEWFYLLLPFVFLLISKIFILDTIIKRKRYFVLILLFFITIPFLIRLYNFEYNSTLNADIDNNFRKVLIFRLDAIVYGVLGAYISFYYSTFWFKIRYLCLLISFMILFYLFITDKMIWYFWYLPIDFSLESLIALLLLPFFSSFSQSRFVFFDKIVIFISLISYSMYLLNLSIVLVIIMPRFQRLLTVACNPQSIIFYITSYLFYWFFVIFFSYILYKFFEKPTTKLRDRFSM
ncbi:MAG: acyltransferase [Bacteroidia bacterium]|nr:acyltransferase [Bacteroidia bacterium]